MAKVLVSDTNLSNIADAIRSKNGTTKSYKVAEMATAIGGISVGNGTSEDLSSELSTQNSLITTQETTIDSIISALEGKAAGSGSGSSGTKEYVQVTFNLLANMAIFANIDPTSTLGSTTNGVLAYYGSIALTPEYVAMALGEIFVEKGSCMYFVSDTYLTGTSTVTTSGELEVITNAKNKGVVIKVNGTGSLTFS